MSFSGIIIIDKPGGWTSHDVVAKIRSVMKIKRIGHGGTLDPMATGVLPVFIGRATRAAQFVENAEKEYVAGIRFGIVTDTQDITGNVLSRQDVSVSENELKTVIPQFLGAQRQIPPMYSAVKQNGKKLYQLARAGVEVERPAREIEISCIELADNPAGENSIDHYIRVVCSKGTYIRTLCHDIGQVLKCGAVMSYLRRTRAGVYGIDTAYPLDSVIDKFSPDMLLPADSIFSQYPSVTLSKTDTRKAVNGALRTLSGIEDGKYRFYAPEGSFVLFGGIKNGNVRVIKSFFEV